MTRDEPAETVSEEEFAAMPDRIGEHFDKVRALLDQELDDTDV